VVVTPGTRIPLQLINRVSTKTAHEGDNVYLQTAFPVVIDGRIVIPPGSYVKGTITQIKRPGKISGRGEIYLRFDSLTLPNGVTRDFLGRVGAVDGSSSETLDRTEGKIKGDTSKGKDAATIAQTTAAGAGIGSVIGVSSGRSGLGAGIGSAAGAAAGLAAVLLSRGPEAVLERGSTVDMVLDRQIVFREDELRFGNMAPVGIVPPQPPAGSQGSNIPYSIPPIRQ
jgi:type IV secretion system protein VirB10